MAVALSVLAAIWVVVAGTWGIARSAYTRLEALERSLNQLRRRGGTHGPGAQHLRSRLDKLTKDVERIAVKLGPPESDKFGVRSLERRYADVLTQPPSVPNSQLLAYLEILTKEATTRRADVAVMQDLLTELRALRERQEAPTHQPS